MNNKSHLTAIYRHKLSLPARWLKKEGWLTGRVLDYGCGRGKDAFVLGCAKYDPYYFPVLPEGTYSTILCTYVLNTLLPEDRETTIDKILGLLPPGGRAFFAVRRDLQREGYSTIGTFQSSVFLPSDRFTIILENRYMAIYTHYKGG